VFRGFESRDAAEAEGFTDDDLASGPRWRLKANKFGQDIPGVEIPLEENSQPPYQSDNIRYEVGTLTTTTLNLLDWADTNGNGLADDSPLRFSKAWTTVTAAQLDANSDGLIDAGWKDVTDRLGGTYQPGDAVPAEDVVSAVSPNGMKLTEDGFDIAVYMKGDRQGNADIFSAQLVLEYESPDAPAPVTTTLDLAVTAEEPSLAELGKTLAAGFNGALAAAAQEPGVVDVDQPLNTNPDFTSSHVFGTADITGLFDGTRVGDGTAMPPIIDYTADPMVTQEGVELFPLNSEFGYLVTDFDSAVPRDFYLNPEYWEGYAGDIIGPLGEQEGLVVSNEATDTFLTPARMGTWLVGMGGSSVKASTEHYGVMQAILSDQYFPEDPNAVYELDDNLIIVGGLWDGQAVADVLASEGDINGDGVADIRDVLQPNESTITENIAVSSDYSVTLKDDGKLLYRWGNMIKKPVDIRMQAELDLPHQWDTSTDASGELPALYRITSAELVVRHNITNNPNDQIRPEDYENESATGRLPSYDPITPDEWQSIADYYAGDGTFYPTGTLLRDPIIAAGTAGTLLADIGATSPDLDDGFTNAWYTTMDREPFEAVVDGEDYEVGPRWRLKSNKYGQDLPGVEIPLDPSLPPPPKKDEIKYEVGAETQTVINLLDWTGPSPLSISAGWQDAAGTVTENGVVRTNDFDVAIYVKGDRNPATLYDATLVMDYEPLPIAAEGATVTGTTGDDILVGQGGNTFFGDAGDDMFVIAYGAATPGDIVASTVTDFGDGIDEIAFVDLGVTEDDLGTRIVQTVAGSDLDILIDGNLAVTLLGVAEELDAEEFFFANVTRTVAPVTAAQDRDADGAGDLLWRLADGTVEGELSSDGTGEIYYADPSWTVADVKDFTGDGRPDLLWIKESTGATWLTALQDNTVVAEGGWGAVGNTWHIVGTPDLDADGKHDVLWRKDTGGLYAWTLDGLSITGQKSLGGLSTAWHLDSTPDLDGDGADDLLWRNDDGTLYGWLMDGTSIKGQGVIGTASPTLWEVAGTPDLDGNGTADILWVNTSGYTWVQLLDGVSTVSQGSAGSAPGWSVAGTADLDGNGTDDVVWENGNTSQLYAWLMDGTSIASQGVVGSAAGADVIDFLDTDGDGSRDIQLRDAISGEISSIETAGLAVLDQPVLATIPDTATYLTEGVGLWDDGGLV